MRFDTVVIVVCSFAILTASSFPACGQDRRCLSIADVNARIECLEGGGPPSVQQAPPPAGRQPAQVRSRASFDCRAARTLIERTICADPTLSEWDFKMGQAYQQLARQKIGTEAQALNENQRQWLLERSSYCSSSAPSAVSTCLLESTRIRLRSLEEQILRAPAPTVVAPLVPAPPTPSPQAAPPLSLAPSAQSTIVPLNRTGSSADEPRSRPAASPGPNVSTQPAARVSSENGRSTPLPSTSPTSSHSSTKGSDGESGLTIVLFLVAIVVLWVTIKVFKYLQRKKMLTDKYGAVIAARILAKEVWMDMSEDQLLESWGIPVEKGYEVRKTGTKETWKYQQTGKGRFANRVFVENGRVSGWKSA